MKEQRSTEQPFGNEWLKEVMKLPKKYIIEEFTKQALIKNQNLEDQNRELIEVLDAIDNYLSPNPKNYIGCGSIIHQRVKYLLRRNS